MPLGARQSKSSSQADTPLRLADIRLRCQS